MSRLKDLFNAAIDLKPEDRVAFLDRECASDPELRCQIDNILRAHDDPVVLAEDRTGTFNSDEPATGTYGNPEIPTGAYEPRPDAGTVIGGRFKLIELIGG